MHRKIKALDSLRRRFGLGWLISRLGYALRMRTGILRLQIPSYRWVSAPLRRWLHPDVPAEPTAYASWREANTPAFVFDELPALNALLPWDARTAVAEAERILTGEFKFFEHQWFQLGFPPNWTLDPLTQKYFGITQHWTQIPDDGPYDIKYVWEASRFAFVFTLIRAYAATHDERFPAAFWSLVEDWAEQNPPGMGPNWKCGQEASLRLLAWCFGLYTFRGSPHTTPERLTKLAQFSAALAQRIYRNLDYAISTRANHMVSEAFGVWLAGLLFPEFKDAPLYLKTGRALLEQAAGQQIFPDGAYSMYSVNYNRFILHVYLLALRLGDLNKQPFSEDLRRAVSASVDHLAQLIDPESGQMPEYGSIDGALVLPLNTCDYTDYRPVLQLGACITRGARLFPPGPWDEDLLWLCGPQSLEAPLQPPQQQDSAFPDGGIYTLRGPSSKVTIRCASHRERPSHADQLHLDLFWHGQSVAIDAGTYLYNGSGIWQNGLARSAVHNTVTVDGEDQMQRLTRFTWGNWSEGRVLPSAPTLTWRGEHDGYTRLPDPVTH
ncbi:MAG: alginate lyase family protein, partial [Anaerolineaceae bacterium]|nr:alginate lyase family protein [Anaerolineaceae bacterium]